MSDAVRIPKHMRAVVYRGIGTLRLETLPVPAIGTSELLVKVAACGVCPTDIKKIQYGTVPPPRVFGHETAGTVVRAGSRVVDYKVGDRVALHHHVPCLNCHACRHQAFAQCPQYKRTGITAGLEPAGGGYAEYVRVMPFVLPGVVRIPRRNTFVEGAMLEPVNTVLKGVRRLQVRSGDAVLVTGQGPIGLMFTRLLTLEGAQVIATDLFETRLRLAKEFGARACVQIREGSAKTLRKTVDRITKGRGADAVVVAVPLDAVVQEAFELVRGAGRILLFSHTKRGGAMALDLANVCVDEKDLLGSYSADFLLQKEVSRLVFSRALDTRRLISHLFPLARTSEAVDLASTPSPDSLKIVVTHDSGQDG